MAYIISDVLLCIFLLQVLIFTDLISLTETVQAINVKYATVPDISNYHLGESLFMQIVEPEDIAYLFKLRPAKNFGGEFQKQYFGIHMVSAEPNHACSPLTNSEYLNNAVVLIERGGCSFVTKTHYVQQVGGVAALIADNDVQNYEHYIDMIKDETKREITIPALFLLGKDGFMIKKSLEKARLLSAVVNIPINITGVPIMRVNQPPWTFW